MKVSELKLHRPVILGDTDSIKQAAMAMNQGRIGSVMYSDSKGNLLGIVTDRDLALALTVGELSASLPLGQLPRQRLHFVSADSELEDVIQLMVKQAIRRVPVVKVKSQGKLRCVGVVTLDDLVRGGLVTPKQQSEILASQLKAPPRKLAKRHLKTLFQSHDHRDQAAHDFYRMVQRSTGLSESDSRSLTYQVLGALALRAPGSSSRKFLAQFPREIQEGLKREVEHERVDRSLKSQYLIESVGEHYGLKPEEAKQVLQKFWQAISKKVSKGEMEIFTGVLPKEMRRAFLGETGYWSRTAH